VVGYVMQKTKTHVTCQDVCSSSMGVKRSKNGWALADIFSRFLACHKRFLLGRGIIVSCSKSTST